MRFGMKTLDDIDVDGKTVLVRIDVNEPIDRPTGTLKDTARVRACVPTIRELASRNAKVVLLAHQGSDIEYENFYTTRPHGAVLSGFLGKTARFVDDVCGPAAREAIRALAPGEILLLDNVRFLAEEQTLFELRLRLTHEQQAETLLVRTLAPLADLYVSDAFAAAHRDQPSLCGFERVLPSAMGRLFEKEFSVIAGLMESPARPSVFVLGGAKIDDAFCMLGAVLGGGAADKVLTGGLVAQLLRWSVGGEIGGPSREYLQKGGYDGLLEAAKKLREEYGARIVTPRDFAYIADGTRREADAASFPADGLIVDIGKETAALYREEILAAKTVFVNGPVGVFEREESELGTKAVYDALDKTAAFTVVGGGDSIAAANRYGARVGYTCTGGGALIRFLSGEELPAVRALRYGSRLGQTLI